MVSCKRSTDFQGLRWIFEALSNGDLSGINPSWFCDGSSEDVEKQREAKKIQLDAVIAKLKHKNHIIVGHNLFTDLAFLYNTFWGTLPQRVELFQVVIHELFANVIDTKYLATEGADSMHVRTNLKDLWYPFKKIHAPLVLLHEKHTAYGSSLGKDHEAGFDSMCICFPLEIRANYDRLDDC